MRVLVACEFSGTVRDAFLRRGHDAWSCDVYPSTAKGPHIQRDVSGVLGDGWDLMVAHPSCTHLAASGRRWFKRVDKQLAQIEALSFFKSLLDAPIERIAVENPIGVVNTRIRKPNQIIQPWQFGHGETKATCLWLKNLPPLTPTDVVSGRYPRVHRTPPGKYQGWLRSLTPRGIAEAMADQWGSLEAVPACVRGC